MLKNCCIALVLMMLTACATLKPQAPQLTGLSVKLGAFGLLQQEMKISLTLQNPNPYQLPVQNLSYKLVAGNNVELGSGQTGAASSLPAMGTGQIELSFKANLLTTLLQLQPDLRQGGELPVQLLGQVKIYDWLTVPLAKTTSLKLR